MSDYVELGEVKGASGYSYTITWSEDTKKVYAGNKHIATAYSAREAMQKAEAWAVQSG